MYMNILMGGDTHRISKYMNKDLKIDDYIHLYMHAYQPYRLMFDLCFYSINLLMYISRLLGVFIPLPENPRFPWTRVPDSLPREREIKLA